jgi:hypothetical protein
MGRGRAPRASGLGGHDGVGARRRPGRELLRCYEKDEARHVGLSTQFAPILLRQQRGLEASDTMALQLRQAFWTTASLKAMEHDLQGLGIEAPRLVEPASGSRAPRSPGCGVSSAASRGRAGRSTGS